MTGHANTISRKTCYISYLLGQTVLIIPPLIKINAGSICAASQKRLFHIHIRLFAGEVGTWEHDAASASLPQEPDHLFLKVDRRLIRVELTAIECIEAFSVKHINYFKFAS
jgi:hypothetical protein